MVAFRRRLGHLAPLACERGMTLLESLVLISLVGILAAISTPSIVRSLSSHAVDQEARVIHSWLASARADAVAQQRDYRFELASDGSYEVQRDDDGTWDVEAASEAGDLVSIELNGETSGAMVFHLDGTVDSPGSFVIDDGSHERTINVLASGLVRWEGRSK